jgi:hypothetical protein
MPRRGHHMVVSILLAKSAPTIFGHVLNTLFASAVLPYGT